ncbi:MAG TPA: tetratricopeptide repeat protein [Candidatus Obscuribacterales bacterium]
MILFVSLCIAFALNLEAACAAGYEEVLYEGLRYLANKDFRQAENCFQKAYQLNPTDADAVILLAKAKAYLRKYKEAIELSKKVIAMDPQFVQAYDTIGFAYLNLHDYEKGIKYLTKSLQLNPENQTGEKYLAVAYNRLGKEPPPYVPRLLDDSKTMTKVSNAMQEQKWDAAIAVINEYLRTHPNDPEAYLKRGSLYELSHRLPAAIDDYTRVLKIHPCHELANEARALAYHHNHQETKSIDDLIKMMRAEPTHWSVHYRLAHAYSLAGKPKEAIKIYSGLLKIHTSSLEARMGRGDAYLQNREYENAIQDFTQFLKADPERSGSAYYKRGLAYERLGKNEQAKADFAMAAKLGYKPNPDKTK